MYHRFYGVLMQPWDEEQLKDPSKLRKARLLFKSIEDMFPEAYFSVPPSSTKIPPDQQPNSARHSEIILEAPGQQSLNLDDGVKRSEALAVPYRIDVPK